MTVRLFFKVSISIGCIFVAQAAWAIIGTPVFPVWATDAESVCEISQTYPRYQTTCSGTLVSPTEILTAGHCFGRYYRAGHSSISIQCGGLDVGSVQSVELPDPENDDFWLSDQEPTHAQDIATIVLSRPAFTRPAIRAKSAQNYFALNTRLKDGIDCKIQGFGNDNYGVMGELREASLAKLALNFFAQPHASLEGGVIYLGPMGMGYLPLSVDSGDSGGPLFCRLPGAPYELIGVIVGYAFEEYSSNRVFNFINPVWLHVK